MYLNGYISTQIHSLQALVIHHFNEDHVKASMLGLKVRLLGLKCSLWHLHFNSHVLDVPPTVLRMIML